MQRIINSSFLTLTTVNVPLIVVGQVPVPSTTSVGETVSLKSAATPAQERQLAALADEITNAL